ncbi:MAG: radical SAM protein [Clostridium sp.]|nr:radical SAM protein [Clostridium sp.]
MNKLLPKLRVSIIDRCQLKCVFCGGNDNKMENFQPEYMDTLLSTEKLLKIIKQYVCSGGKYVQFTGGEPLLRKDLEYIVSKTYEFGGIPEINTNGLLLTYEKALKLKEAGINIIKVSIPSFDRETYKKLTRVDALDKVLNNISNALKVVDIRINMVATRESMKNIDKAIETCRSLKVKQLLLLELLYYPHVENEKKVFEDKYVDIRREYGEHIEKITGTPFKPFSFNNRFENTLSVSKSLDNKFEIYVKQANPVLRVNKCYECSHFCQEGIYELRLSTGGYLSFCNICNDFGIDISKINNDEEILSIFTNYKEILAPATESKFDEFISCHKLCINNK